MTTPEELARTTLFSYDDWCAAYEKLGARSDWPQIATWPTTAGYNPRQLPGLVADLEILAKAGMTVEEATAGVGDMSDLRTELAEEWPS